MFQKPNRPERGKRKNRLANVMAGSLVMGMLAFSPVNANAEVKLSTVYHVYVDDAYVGAATDKQIVEAAADKAVKKAGEELKGYELELGNHVTYIAEQAFRPVANDGAVEKKMEELAKVKAVSTAISIAGKNAVHVKDEETAKKVLEQIKLTYASEAEVKAAEKRKNAAEELPPMEKDELRTMDVRIVEEAELKKEAVFPEEILSAEDAVKLLLKGTLEEQKYTVQEGDVLGKIAAKHELSTEQLIGLNEGMTEDTVLQIGQEVNTVVLKPLIHVEIVRDLLREEEVPFEVETVEDSNLPKGETKVTQEGKNGNSFIQYRLIEKNGKEVSKEKTDEKVIEAPVKKVVVEGTKVIPSRGTGQFAWPTNGGYVSSRSGQRWGRQHKGIDIARPSNYTIKAADHGIVVSAGWNSGGYGNKIVIDHQNGYRTVYAHLNAISVKPGQKVEKGSAIGVMGSTGDSTGIHLHFELYKNGGLQNPLNYLP